MSSRKTPSNGVPNAITDAFHERTTRFADMDPSRREASELLRLSTRYPDGDVLRAAIEEKEVLDKKARDLEQQLAGALQQALAAANDMESVSISNQRAMHAAASAGAKLKEYSRAAKKMSDGYRNIIAVQDERYAELYETLQHPLIRRFPWLAPIARQIMFFGALLLIATSLGCMIGYLVGKH